MGAELSTAGRGRPALITGGASGIGLAVARRAAELGLSPIILCDVDAAGLSTAQRDLPAEVETVVLDVRDAAANERVATDVFRRHGDLAFLFVNAGLTTMAVGHDSILYSRQRSWITNACWMWIWMGFGMAFGPSCRT